VAAILSHIYSQHAIAAPSATHRTIKRMKKAWLQKLILRQMVPSSAQHHHFILGYLQIKALPKTGYFNSTALANRLHTLPFSLLMCRGEVFKNDCMLLEVMPLLLKLAWGCNLHIPGKTFQTSQLYWSSIKSTVSCGSQN